MYDKFLGGTGSEQSDNGRWTYDPLRDRFKPRQMGFERMQSGLLFDWMLRLCTLPKPIDHPYLLPPATFTIANRVKNGELWWVKDKGSVLCDGNGYPIHDSYETETARHFRMADEFMIHAIRSGVPGWI